MRTEHITQFTESELPKSDHERLLRLLFGGNATNSPATGALLTSGVAGNDVPREAEPGARGPSSPDALPSAAARPGSVSSEAVA